MVINLDILCETAKSSQQPRNVHFHFLTWTENETKKEGKCDSLSNEPIPPI